ncbi:MAG: UDP-glucose 4-epimerase GalE [Phycisphaerales bacterium]|nr:UDP-glucose 4-epimerase GalE [Phycisphaerales bacterium]
MKVLVTGGAGYIGSHTALSLLASGHEVVLLDNLRRGHRKAAEIVVNIAGSRGAFVEADVGDANAVAAALTDHGVEAVIHFAALAYVGESVELPLQYWRANLAGSLGLLEAMDRCGVSRLVASSTCSTYGCPDAEFIPIAESCRQDPVNPYGESKLAVERMVRAHAAMKTRSGTPFAFALLRYFNVAGCDPQGRLGEDHEPETHLVPSAILAALGRRPPLQVFGRDWDTHDGTCVRDYVHVTDLAEAHIAVLEKLNPSSPMVFNIGTGRGDSVLEVIKACERATGRTVPCVDAPRRAGDPGLLIADARKIAAELGWRARFSSMDETCSHAAQWFTANPRGYR